MSRNALLLLAVAAGLLGGLQARAAGDALRVPTTYVTSAEERGLANDVHQRLAEGPQVPIALSAKVPAGTARVPAGTLRRYGSLEAGGRAWPFVLAADASGQGVLALDPDGDGSYGGPGAEARTTGRAVKSRGRAATRWTFPDLPFGPARTSFEILDVGPERKAVLVTSDGAEPLALAEKAPEGVRPVGGDWLVCYALVPSGGSDVPIAFVRQGDERLTLLVDRNGNGTLGETQEVVPVPFAGREETAKYWKVEDVEIGASRLTLAFQEVAGETSGRLSAAGARRGEVDLNGRTWALHLVDGDLDGRYGSAGDLWWFGPEDLLAHVKRLGPDTMVEGTAPFFVDGRAWRIRGLEKDGTVVLEEAPDADPESYFRARGERVNRERWFPRFAEEESAFRRDHDMIAARARAAKPLAWRHDVDLGAALAEARRTNRPVCVDFEADWCAWCKRFDYYVYPDAEVASLLSRFVCVKINREFHFRGDFERLGGTSLPYIVFLASDGTPLRFMVEDEKGHETTASGPPGFQSPAVFAGTVRRAWEAWQRSQAR